MNFINYEDVAGRGAMFKYVIENGLMPPWYVAPNTGPWKNDISLTLKERAMLLKWAELGFPKKEKGKNLLWVKRKAEKDKFPADYIIPLPEKVLVPAEGSTIYKTFVVQTNFREDKWIRNVQFILKPKVIHHIAIYIMDSSYDYDINRYDLKEGTFDYHLKTVNFIRHSDFNNNMGKYGKELYKNAGIKLPHNSKLILEIHYEPLGQKIVDDYTQIKMNFYKKPPKYKIVNHYYYAKNINIPPKASNYKMERSNKTEETKILVGLNTHMHLRGKASDVFIVDPKGNRKRIFGIDPWTINFERLYRLKKPLVIPKGSTIECINWFDNSAKNPLNPNPEENVLEGLSLKNEMSNCVFKWLAPANQSSGHTFLKYLY